MKCQQDKIRKIVWRNHAEKKIMMAVGNISLSVFLYWFFLCGRINILTTCDISEFPASFWREEKYSTLMIHGRNKKQNQLKTNISASHVSNCTFIYPRRSHRSHLSLTVMTALKASRLWPKTLKFLLLIN